MDPLAQLKDIHTPVGVDWWPLAWGWWALAIVLIALLGLAVRVLVRHIQFNRARREAQALHSSFNVDEQYPAEANKLLKRVTLHYFDASLSAPVYGKHWQALLEHCLTPKQRSKVSSGLTLLTQSGYQATPLSDDQLQQIHQAVATWLQQAQLKRPPLVQGEQETAHV